MLSRSFCLLFFLKKPKGYAKGPLPIYLCITVGRKRAKVSSKRIFEEVIRWDAAAGRLNGTKESNVTSITLNNLVPIESVSKML